MQYQKNERLAARRAGNQSGTTRIVPSAVKSQAGIKDEMQEDTHEHQTSKKIVKRCIEETQTCHCCQVSENWNKFRTKNWITAMFGNTKAFRSMCEEKAILRKELVRGMTYSVQKSNIQPTGSFLQSSFHCSLQEMLLRIFPLHWHWIDTLENHGIWRTMTNAKVHERTRIYAVVWETRYRGISLFCRSRESQYMDIRVPNGPRRPFLAPIDQPPTPTDDNKKRIFFCKYVLGFGIPSDADIDKDCAVESSHEVPEDYTSTSFLGIPLSEKTTERNLAEVTSARSRPPTHPCCRPKLPPARPIVRLDWFRPRLSTLAEETSATAIENVKSKL